MLELARRFHLQSTNTIKGRFLVITVFLLLVGGLLAVLPLAAFVYDDREQETYKHLNEVLDMQQQAMDNWLNERSEEAAVMASLPQSRSSLYKQIQHFTDRDNQVFDNMSVLNMDGQIIYATNDPKAIDTVNAADREYFQAALAGESFTSSAIRRRSDQEPVIVFSAPLFNEQGVTDGVLAGTVTLEAIASIVNKTSYGETGRFYLTDETGIVLSRRTEADPYSLAEAIIFRLAENGESIDRSYKSAAGENVIGQYRWLYGSQWLLIGEVATKEINGAFWRTIWMMGAILLFIFILAYCVINLLVQQIIFPIHRLLEATVIIRLGNYKHRISEGAAAKSLDEFKALNGAYNQMAQSLEQEFSLRKQAEKDLRQANEMLTRLSLSDSLTGIGNRRYFDDVLGLTWEEAITQKKPMSLLLLDIDFFKKYNDRYGHDAGDKALRRVSETVDMIAKETGTVAARYGGEELAVILPPGVPVESFGLAEKIRCAVENLALLHEDAKDKVITVSIGGATLIPNLGDDPALLIRKADEALYYSKRKGRARTTVYESITP
ncbi:sensor domain-containing diguanylate cyclase [Domibacillus tundrae]|uniref:sensor domain-containing diguanylate cyclase n=1 Tax=Domibacillus tundrae TaxID=1587527 RepID=UPI003398F951